MTFISFGWLCKSIWLDETGSSFNEDFIKVMKSIFDNSTVIIQLHRYKDKDGKRGEHNFPSTWKCHRKCKLGLDGSIYKRRIF